MRLYAVPGWGSAIVEAMLALVGERCDIVDVEGFDRPGAAQERLAAVNPLRQVPTLELDDGEVLTETAAIALWLAERHAELAPPRGTAAYRRFLRLLVWLVANVYPTFTYGDYPERWTPSAPDALVAATDAHRERLYRWLEDQVAGPYVLGAQPSALDCYAAVMIDWRPRRDWFARYTPRLYVAALAMRRDPRLAAAMARNGLSVD